MIELSWPPSTNNLSRAHNGRIISSAEHRTWAKTAAQELAVQRPRKHIGPVSVSIELGPPPSRKFDLDNRVKALLDALVRAEIIGAQGATTSCFWFRSHRGQTEVEQEKRRALIEQAVQKGLLRRINKAPKKQGNAIGSPNQSTPRLRLVWVNPSTAAGLQ